MAGSTNLKGDEGLRPQMPLLTAAMDDKRKHLEMIQGIINRLSTNSFLLKGWSVVLVSALFAFAAKDSKPIFLYLAYFPAFMFWALDGFFLWHERMYRRLYDEVRGMPDENITFSMDTTLIANQVSGWIETCFSKTLLLFHGTVAGTIVLVILYLATR